MGPRCFTLLPTGERDPPVLTATKKLIPKDTSYCIYILKKLNVIYIEIQIHISDETWGFSVSSTTVKTHSHLTRDMAMI